MAPAVGRGSDEARHGDMAGLVLAEIVREADGTNEILLGLAVDQLADVIRHEVGIRARRLVALLPPGHVRLDRRPADELQRLRRGLVAEGLPLKVGRDGEDLESA